MVALAAVPAAASAAVDLDGSFSRAVHKQDYFDGSTCPPNVDGNECGVIQLAGLGPADFVYLYGPTFEPNGTRGCFDLDGTFTISLQSDGSTISGPLTGVLCEPGKSGSAPGGTHSYGNPFSQDDSIEFADGTGQFEGLHGTAIFHQSFAGARNRGTLTGTLSG